MKRGRPKEFDGTPVSVRLPKTLHDALIREAVRRDVDVSDVIRHRLEAPLRVASGTVFRISKLDTA